MRKINPNSLKNLKLSERRGLSEIFQVKVSKEMKERLVTVSPDTARGWLQEKLDSHGSDDTVANELIDRVRRGVFEGLPELQELAHRVGIEGAVKVINSVQINPSHADGETLNRALVMVAASRLAADWWGLTP
jgi:hypothetical protein